MKKVTLILIALTSFCITQTFADNDKKTTSADSSATEMFAANDLMEFDAVLKGNRVYLNWSTATEESSVFFTIYKSYDGESWYKVTNFPGAGESETITMYTYAERTAPGKEVHFKITHTELTGETEEKGIIAVTCPEEDSDTELVVVTIK
jgi:hypothetical protein